MKPAYRMLRGKAGNVVGGIIVLGTTAVNASFGQAIATAYAMTTCSLVAWIYITSKRRDARARGVATPAALSDRIAALAAALRRRADGLNDRYGRKPAAAESLALEEWNDLRNVAELRHLANVVAALDLTTSDDADAIFAAAADLERSAAKMRGTKTPYHLDGGQLTQAIAFIVIIGSVGACLLAWQLRDIQIHKRMRSDGVVLEGTVVGSTSEDVTRSERGGTSTTSRYYHRIVEYSAGRGKWRLEQRQRESFSPERAAPEYVVYLRGNESEAMLQGDLDAAIADPYSAPFYIGVALLGIALLASLIVWRMQTERN